MARVRPCLWTEVCGVVFIFGYDDLKLKSECNTLLLLVTEDTGSGLACGWKEFHLIFYSGANPC